MRPTHQRLIFAGWAMLGGAAAGIAWTELTADQQAMLRRLIEAYCSWMTDDVADERLRLIEEAGWEVIRFSWRGALEPGDRPTLSRHGADVSRRVRQRAARRRG